MVFQQFFLTLSPAMVDPGEKSCYPKEKKSTRFLANTMFALHRNLVFDSFVILIYWRNPEKVSRWYGSQKKQGR